MPCLASSNRTYMHAFPKASPNLESPFNSGFGLRKAGALLLHSMSVVSVTLSTGFCLKIPGLLFGRPCILSSMISVFLKLETVHAGLLGVMASQFVFALALSLPSVKRLFRLFLFKAWPHQELGGRRFIEKAIVPRTSRSTPKWISSSIASSQQSRIANLSCAVHQAL